MLKAAIRAQLEKLIRLNRTRANFADKFEELIESYNAGSRSIEQLFEELVNLSKSLTDEEHRHVRENMSEEELVIFDILTRPAPALTAEERTEVKKVAHMLSGAAQAVAGPELAAKDCRPRPGSGTPLKILSTPVSRAHTRPSFIDRNAQCCSSMCMKAIRSGMPESIQQRSKAQFMIFEICELPE